MNVIVPVGLDPPERVALSLSVTWLIFGLCVVLPWALVGYGGYRLARRLFRAPPAPTTPVP